MSARKSPDGAKAKRRGKTAASKRLILAGPDTSSLGRRKIEEIVAKWFDQKQSA